MNRVLKEMDQNGRVVELDGDVVVPIYWLTISTFNRMNVDPSNIANKYSTHMLTTPHLGVKQIVVEKVVANSPNIVHRKTLKETEEFEIGVNWSTRPREPTRPIEPTVKQMVEEIGVFKRKICTLVQNN